MSFIREANELSSPPLVQQEPKTVAVLPGDGIGPEVTDAAIEVVEQLGLPINFTYGDVGWEFWKTEGTPVPDRTWDLISRSDACLLGAITSKPLREAEEELIPELRGTGLKFKSPVLQLRQKLGLYANVRPITDLIDNKFDFTVIRENTEGLYAGFDYHGLPQPLWEVVQNHPNAAASGAENTSVSLRLQTQQGIDRLLRFGFEYAAKHNHELLSLADKPNVLRNSSNYLRERLELIGREYPQIQTEILNVDALALWMVRRPERFQTIVAENMFGDILSDLGAGVMGGLGLAPSGNIGDHGSYFEPVHGSAPSMAGRNKANPMAMILTIAQMLDHLNYSIPGEQLIDASRTVLKEKKTLTYDLGGTASTTDAAHAVSNALNSSTAASSSGHETNITALVEVFKTLDTASVADALDSLGITGVLPGLQARVPGTHAAGIAYTVQYQEIRESNQEFRNAANYLDEVPEGSFVIVDNAGSTTCTTWGSLLMTVAQSRNLAGTGVYGSARDIAENREADYPLFSSAVTMVSGKNRVELKDTQVPVTIEGTHVRPGDIIVADDNGVLAVPLEHAHEVAERAARVDETEQRIANGVKNGLRLDEAREKFGYAKPWELSGARG